MTNPIPGPGPRPGLDHAPVLIRDGSATPSGSADSVTDLGGGLYLVTTPSHGGIYVPDEQLAKIPTDRVAWSRYWSGAENWFEEDCAACFVVAAFPGLFAPDHVARCREAVETFYPPARAR